MGRILLVASVVVFVLNAVSLAGLNQNAKAAVHVMDHASRTCTKSFPTITKCEDIVYSLQSGDADCFPVFFDLTEYQGFDYGLSWPGAYTCAFTSCSDLTIGSIVYPGDGISHAWYDCRSEGIAVPGWGWIYEPDSAVVCIVVHPVAYAVNIGDCSGGIDQPKYDPYCAGIGGAEGDNPCGTPTANKESTWGAIKGLFE